MLGSVRCRVVSILRVALLCFVNQFVPDSRDRIGISSGFFGAPSLLSAGFTSFLVGGRCSRLVTRGVTVPRLLLQSQ